MYFDVFDAERHHLKETKKHTKRNKQHGRNLIYFKLYKLNEYKTGKSEYNL